VLQLLLAFLLLLLSSATTIVFMLPTSPSTALVDSPFFVTAEPWRTAPATTPAESLHAPVHGTQYDTFRAAVL